MSGAGVGARPASGRAGSCARSRSRSSACRSRAGSAGQVILQCLKVNNFKGDIHLVGRSDEPIDGRPVLKSPDELPEGVDLAVFTLPAAGVQDAVEACARRKVGSAMVFAAGFAEVGDSATQDAVTKTARDGGLALVGPNCLGVTNNVDGMMLHMLYAREALRGVENRRRLRRPERRPARPFPARRRRPRRAAVLCHLDRQRSRARNRPISSNSWPRIPRRGVIAIYCEEIRRPQRIPRCHPPRAGGRQAGRG